MFTPAVAAKILRLPVGTVRWWILGTASHPPPLHIADPDRQLVSFRNVVEIHLLHAVAGHAREHLPLAVVRTVLASLAEQFGSSHPLSDPRMEPSGKEFLAARLGAFSPSARHGQAELADALEVHLERVVRDERGEPERLLLFTRRPARGPGHVMMDPAVHGGHPCITGTDLTTRVVVDRFEAGDSAAHLAAVHGRSVEEIEEAIRYELVAA